MARKRPGRTVKLSVSLDADDVAALRQRAREAYDGNLSAAVSEATKWLRQQAARRRLIDELGGPGLTDEGRAAIDAEQAGGPRYEPKRARRKKSAA